MAVQTKTQMATELSTNFGDGGAATVAEFRAVLTDILDSYALSLAEADIIPNADSTLDLGSTTVAWAQAFVDDLYVRQGIIITEAADHPITPAAGQAQIWVENTATQTLQVTFDDGSDAEILTGGSGTSLTAATSAGADLLPFFDSSDSNNPKSTTITNLIADNALTTATGTQTLTNKTLTTPTINDPRIAHEYNAQTGTTYTLVAADQSAVITMNNASANTLTIPPNSSVAFPIGSVIAIYQLGAGATTITGGTGVTVNGVSTGGAAIQNQYGAASIVKVATDTWLISGDIGAVA